MIYGNNVLKKHPNLKIINGDIQKLVDELMLAENTEILKASNENI